MTKKEVSELIQRVEYCATPVLMGEPKCSVCEYRNEDVSVTCRALVSSCLVALKELERYKKLEDADI